MLKVKRIGITEILGREIEFYNTWDEPLFRASDVAYWLDERDGSTVSRKVDEDEKIKVILDTQNVCSHGGERENVETTMFTEDGLYEALMKSRKDIARDLKKQIKSYLKQIRKTGGTVEEGREEDFINNYFPSFSEEVKLSMVQDLLRTNKELKPKAEYCDSVLNPTNLKTTTDIAKDLGMSAKASNKILNEKGIIYPKKVDGKTKGWYLYSEYDKLVPEYADYKINEHGQQLKWTEKGRHFILELLNADQHAS